MDKKYLAQIIATDNEGLQMISAYTTGAKVNVADIKYLASNKVFLLSIVITAVERNSDCAYSTESRILDKQPSTLGIITCF